jgi:hypothetical protein
MSRRGEVTVECDSCEGEHIFCPDDFEGATMEFRLGEIGFSEHGTGKGRQDLCDVCLDEIADGARCDRCWTKLEPNTICGDCYGGTEVDPQARSLETAAFPFAENH